VIDTVQIVILLLLASMTLGVLARRIGMPYPIALTLGGLALGFVPGLPAVRLNPDIVFAVFLPPILYRAALFGRWHDFRANLRPIAMLAIGLVIFTTVAVAVVGRAIVPDAPWAALFVLGAIVSPPDAVAVTAILHRLRLPSRIIAVIEGESLVNDAAAIILYKFALAALLTGAFSAGDAVIGFVGVAVGGTAIGLALGWASVRIHGLLKDTLSETMLSLAVPYVAYGLADALGVSGVLAVIAAGVWRAFAGHTVLSAETRQHTFGMWDAVVFFLNSLVFTLIGLQLPPIMEGLDGYPALTLLGYAAAVSLTVIVARILWVFPTTYGPRLLSRRLRAYSPPPPWRATALVSYVGMRGIVSLAIAMALPLAGPDGAAFPARNLLVFLTFAVIVTTLVFQGLSLPFVLRWLGFSAATGPAANDAERLARLKMAYASVAEVDRLAERDDLPPTLVEPVRTEFAAPLAEPATVSGFTADAVQDMQRTLRLAGVLAARRRLVKLHRTDEIDDELLQTLLTELDYEELRAQGASATD
jgi:CPA1 family monovalent cation:H+ antiporter